MLDAVLCLTDQHDWHLLALAAVICFCSCLSTFNLFGRMRVGMRRQSSAWILLVGSVAGCGVWATHFIATLAYESSRAVSYDIGLTSASLAIAIVMYSLAFSRIDAQRSTASLMLAGGLMAVGTAAMHFTGVAALQLSGGIVWRSDLIALSLGTGGVLATLAFFFAMRSDRLDVQVLASFVLASAILFLHLIAMQAGRFVGEAQLPAHGLDMSPAALSMTIAGVILAVLGMTMIGAMGDRQLDEQARRFRDELFERERAFRAMYENNPIPMFVFDRKTLRFLTANETALELYGYAKEEFLTKTLLDIRPPEAHAFVHESLTSGGTPEKGMIVRHVNSNGDPLQVAIHASRLPYGSHEAIFVTVMDLTVRQKAEQALNFLADHDGLTNLPNRAAFSRVALRKVDEALESKASLALLYIDLNQFSGFNIARGHHLGDELLRQAAGRMKAVAADNLIARIAADEFVILVDGPDKPEGAAELAARLHQELSAPFVIAGSSSQITLSIGVALVPDDATNLEDLIINANTAQLRARSDGRGLTRFFSPRFDVQLRQRAQLLDDLRDALVRREFVLFYQPQFNVTGGLVGFEALIRWKSPKRGLVPPGVFIPLAEESGLILEIADWTLHEACREAVNWPRDLTISVNLSPIQFRDDGLPSRIQDILSVTGLAPTRLELEITEGILLENREQTLAILRDLKKIGIRISMDDFGTGYSSLSYLQSFPFDKIKIDQSFVFNIGKPNADAIISAIIGLGHGLGLPVIAEGVETMNQLSFLRRAGCDEVQGYLLGHPRPISEHEALLTIASAVPVDGFDRLAG